MFVATIDTGTTNTRVTIWKDASPEYTAHRPAGVRMTSINRSNNALVQAVREALAESVANVGITEADLKAILASGMITSDLGIFEVPHVVAPVSEADLAGQIVKALIPEVSESSPIYFIPGIKNRVNNLSAVNCEEMDIMRGEETEAFGIIARESLQGPAILVLPGSHTKFIYFNAHNQIEGCMTTLAGEMLMQLTEATILTDSLNAEYAEAIDEKWIIDGAESAKKVGLNRTASLIRILDLFTDASLKQRANFLLGAVVQTDITALLNSSIFHLKCGSRILVCSNSVFSAAMFHILKNTPVLTGKITQISPGAAQNLAGYGAIHLAQKAGII
ncbi:MAG: 2-dehydro-3-deoxygalactonokinase [Eubacteriales bacterium]